MKGIILHGGHGTRLRPLTHTGPKQLLPIANKPMSQYSLESLRNIGISEIAIIIGDVYSDKVKEFYGTGEKFGIKITYVYQDQPHGIAHAVRLCKDFVGDDSFVVFLGDNILRKGLLEYKNKFEEQKPESLILLCEVDDPSRFGIAEVENNNVTRIVEKPKHPKSNLAVIGVYFFTPKIFDIIDNLKPSWRNELEITDAIQQLLVQGYSINHSTVTGWWKDTGTPEDVIHANKLILDTLCTENEFTLNSGYQIKDNVILGKNSSITRDTSITGPIMLGNNCHIGPHVKLGPNVSIGDNTTIKNCEVENSIIMENCRIDAKISLSHSIIASGSEITINSQRNKQHFLLGERSQIKL